jgi:hypothetical protein
LNRHVRLKLGLLAVALLATVVCIVVMAGTLRSPELIRRSGALLSGLGAALVIYQALIEARFERKQHADLSAAESVSPINREIADRILRERSVTRTSDRIGIVIAIAAVVCVGELLHGWGDFLYIGNPGIEGRQAAESDR